MLEAADAYSSDVAKCSAFRYPTALYLHIYQRPNSHISLRTFFRAHEETHALDFLRERPILDDQPILLLEKRLYSEQNVEIDLRSLGEEVLADFGGIYALVRKRLDPHDPLLLASGSSYCEALRLYDEARRPSR